MQQLIDRIDAQSAAIRTLSLTVDLSPAAGSVYSGVIREYHDVKGFILVQRPEFIRMIGQAPVVRTNIFDMVSDGHDFEVYLPTRQKFIVGRTTYHRPAQNALESLRPQHILDALLIPPIEPGKEKFFMKEDQTGSHRYYVVYVVEAATGAGTLALEREIWFDRSTLDIARLQLYGPDGTYLEDIRYSGYQMFQGVRYPTSIQINRPVEDYSLAINIIKAKINGALAPGSFVLKKPESAQLVQLSEMRQPEATPSVAAQGA